MFKKFKYVNNMTKICNILGDSFDNPSKETLIAAMVLYFPLFGDNKKNMYLSKDYIVSELAALASSYIMQFYDYDDEYPNIDFSEVDSKIFIGIDQYYKYKINTEEFNNLNSRNTLMFHQHLYAQMDHKEFTQQAFIAFAVRIIENDLINKCCAEYNDDSPVPIFDITEHVKIMIEAKAHFENLFKLIDNIVKESNNNSTK